MARHMISVCIFCFICATHSPCASHAATSQEYLSGNKGMYNHGAYSSIPAYEDSSRLEKLKPNSLLNVLNSGIRNGRRHRLEKRKSDNSGINKINSDKDLDFIKKIFEFYGDGETMNIQGFRSLVSQLSSHHHDHLHEHSTHSEHLVHREVKMSIESNEADVENETVRFC